MGEGNGTSETPAAEADKTDDKKRRTPVRRALWLMVPATWRTVPGAEPDSWIEEPDTWFVSKHETKDSIRKELERRGIDPKKPETLKHMKIVRMDEVEFKASTQVLLEF